MSRARYWLRFDVEVPAATLADAEERALRLFRGQVRAGLRQTVAYQGSYRRSWFTLTRLEKPPGDRVDLKKRGRKLKTLPRDVPAPAPAVATNPAPRRTGKPIRGTQTALFAGMEAAAT